jgi:hypothetical protein
MTAKGVVPNVFDGDPVRTRRFYTDLFDFEVAMDMGWIATLVSPGGQAAQISVFEPDGEEGRDPFISIEVADADAVHARAAELDYDVAYPLRD